MLGISKNVPDGEALLAELSDVILGEVLLDPISRGLYATDASLYQNDPIAVVIPHDADDIRNAMAVARRRGLAVLPRGGGTSLAGQATGRALILDTSKSLTRILELNEAERWIRVQPGLVRDELNAAIASTGLHFAPETATSNRANIGGMIGNNSSGTKSIFYGKTVDHVLELRVVLATGEELHTRAMSREKWNEIAFGDSREGEIYRTVRDVIDANREEIAARYPKVMRRVGGYNLDEFPTEGPWNLSKIICGSEGTLATIIEATLNLERLPTAKALCVVHFRQIPEALRAVEAIVGHGPSAVELLDRTVLDMARANLETARMCDWIEGSPGAVLITEFFGESVDELTEKIEALTKDLSSAGFGYAAPVIFEAAAQAKVWGVRAAGLGLMLGMKGDAKPLPFIEDCAVPVASLPDYIGDVLAVCKDLGVDAAMYAHASVGLIHVRPILNLKLAEDVERMKKISESTFELVVKYGGSWSGEHGDGLVRSYKNEEFFGPQLYAAFKSIKHAFDPEGRMNPGKIVDAGPIDENLRISPQYRPERRRTHFHFHEDGGFAQAVELCTGVGACRKTGSGTMCPSYIATRDEMHTTRGRANALRLAMTGQLGADAMTSPELYDVLDLCLGCKGCKAECPSNVDLARLKSEFLAGYYVKHRVPLSVRFFAAGPRMAEFFSGRLAPLANRANEHPQVRALMEKLLGVDRRRPLPRLAEEPLSRWFERRRPASSTAARRVVLFDDTYINYHEPSIGRAAVGLLEALGYRVQLARAGCCARPLISMGLLDEARRVGTRTMQKLNGYLMDDLPIVVCEPSCLSALADDLPDLIENTRMGRRVASGVMMIDAFIAREIETGHINEERIKELITNAAAPAGPSSASEAEGPRYLIHGHCHQKALYGTGAMKSLLGMIDGARVDEIDSGCCGMAGSFGYETEHYDLSMKIGEDRLFPGVREMAPGTRLIACGFSCRHQIRDALGVESVHWVQAMADAVGCKY